MWAHETHCYLGEQGLRKRRVTGLESSLEDFFVVEKEEQFWCVLCEKYVTIEERSGRMARYTCGCVGIIEGDRRLTRHHKEVDK